MFETPTAWDHTAFWPMIVSRSMGLALPELLDYGDVVVADE